MERRSLVVPALLAALGLAAGGWLAGRGFERSRLGDRFVTVKGLAERGVEADLASWPLRFTATGAELAAVQASLEQDLGKVRAFLAAQGFRDDEIRLDRLEVTDLLAQPWRSQQEVGENRFIVAQTVVVRSEQVQRVADASRRVGDLVRQGVVLAETTGPQYAFTKLNDVKPDLLAEATRAARSGAEQFAADSGSRVGGIRRATQGVITILPRDPGVGGEESQVEKTVRVVATVDYALE